MEEGGTLLREVGPGRLRALEGVEALVGAADMEETTSNPGALVGAVDKADKICTFPFIQMLSFVNF